MQVQDKVIVVSGGASGLGRATSEYFLSKGARIVVLDLNEEAGSEMIEATGNKHMLFQRTDVTNADSVSTALHAAVNQFGTVHADINCAGIPGPSKIIGRDGNAMPLEKFVQVINVNLIGVFNVMSQCAAIMTRNEPDDGGERGVIVNISSGAAFEGQIGQSAYGASKSGVLGLNMPGARELGPLGIRVNAICPGLFGTPLVKGLDQKVQDSLVEMIEAPKRMGHLDEFAHCCQFLIENGYMNGRTIRLDAATVMQAR